VKNLMTKRQVQEHVKRMQDVHLSGWEFLAQQIMEAAVELVERHPRHLWVRFSHAYVSFNSEKHPGLTIANQDPLVVQRAVKVFKARYLEPVEYELKQGLHFGQVDVAASKNGKAFKYLTERPGRFSRL
jgi:hypothetical protein